MFYKKNVLSYIICSIFTVFTLFLLMVNLGIFGPKQNISVELHNQSAALMFTLLFVVLSSLIIFICSIIIRFKSDSAKKVINRSFFLVFLIVGIALRIYYLIAVKHIHTMDSMAIIYSVIMFLTSVLNLLLLYFAGLNGIGRAGGLLVLLIGALWIPDISMLHELNLFIFLKTYILAVVFAYAVYFKKCNYSEQIHTKKVYLLAVIAVLSVLCMILTVFSQYSVMIPVIIVVATAINMLFKGWKHMLIFLGMFLGLAACTIGVATAVNYNNEFVFEEKLEEKSESLDEIIKYPKDFLKEQYEEGTRKAGEYDLFESEIFGHNFNLWQCIYVMCLILSCSSAVIMLFEKRSALNQIMLYMPVIYLIDRHQMILLSLTGAYTIQFIYNLFVKIREPRFVLNEWTASGKADTSKGDDLTEDHDKSNAIGEVAAAREGTGISAGKAEKSDTTEKADVIKGADTIERSDIIEKSNSIENADTIDKINSLETADAMEVTENIDNTGTIETADTIDNEEAIYKTTINEADATIKNSDTIENTDTIATKLSSENNASIEPVISETDERKNNVNDLADIVYSIDDLNNDVSSILLKNYNITDDFFKSPVAEETPKDEAPVEVIPVREALAEEDDTGYCHDALQETSKEVSTELDQEASPSQSEEVSSKLSQEVSLTETSQDAPLISSQEAFQINQEVYENEYDEYDESTMSSCIPVIKPVILEEDSDYTTGDAAEKISSEKTSSSGTIYTINETHDLEDDKIIEKVVDKEASNITYSKEPLIAMDTYNIVEFAKIPVPAVIDTTIYKDTSTDIIRINSKSVEDINKFKDEWINRRKRLKKRLYNKNTEE